MRISNRVCLLLHTKTEKDVSYIINIKRSNSIIEKKTDDNSSSNVIFSLSLALFLLRCKCRTLWEGQSCVYTNSYRREKQVSLNIRYKSRYICQSNVHSFFFLLLDVLSFFFLFFSSRVVTQADNHRATVTKNMVEWRKGKRKKKTREKKKTTRQCFMIELKKTKKTHLDFGLSHQPIDSIRYAIDTVWFDDGLETHKNEMQEKCRFILVLY